MAVNLAIIIGQLSLGGAEQQLYHLVSRIDRQRFNVAVISLGPKADEYWKDPILNLGIQVRHIPRTLGRGFRSSQHCSYVAA